METSNKLNRGLIMGQRIDTLSFTMNFINPNNFPDMPIILESPDCIVKLNKELTRYAQDRLGNNWVCWNKIGEYNAIIGLILMANGFTSHTYIAINDPLVIKSYIDDIASGKINIEPEIEIIDE